ncbi:unnamed protein product [Ectocarpus sp. 12 AP-2014]
MSFGFRWAVGGKCIWPRVDILCGFIRHKEAKYLEMYLHRQEPRQRNNTFRQFVGPLCWSRLAGVRLIPHPWCRVRSLGGATEPCLFRARRHRRCSRAGLIAHAFLRSIILNHHVRRHKI